MEKFYKKIVVLMLLIMGLTYNSLYAQIAGWSAFGVTASQPSLPVSLSNENLTVGPIILGGGLSRGTLTNGFGAVQNEATPNFAGEGGGRYADQAEQHALSKDQYFEFDITAKPNYTLSLSALNFKIRISQTGRFFLLQYKVGNGTFKNAATRQQYVSNTNGDVGGSGFAQTAIALSDIAELNSISAGTKVTFRLYYGGSTNATTVTALGASASDTEYALSISGDLIPDQKIIGWQFGNPKSNGNELTYAASFIKTGLNVPTLVRGAGLRTTTANGITAILYPGAFVAGATHATTAVSASDIADAIAHDLYFAFEIKPLTNYKASLSKLRAKVRASGGGAKTWLWRYSTDNVNFTDLGTAYYNPNTIAGGVYMPEVDLSGITALQNILSTTTIYFRLYLQGANDDTGSSGIGVSTNEDAYMLSLNGTVESTLPVKLTKFTGENIGRNVRLNWATSSEKQNAYFEVLRIQKDKSPLSLGKVLGSGNSDEVKTYNFTDYSPLSGTNYYQLRQVDLNGDSELSEVIPVKVSLTSSELLAYFKDDVLNLSFEAENEGTVDLKLVDMSGRQVYKATVRLQTEKNELQVPTRLNKGIYVVSLSGNNISISKKIIK